MDQNNGTSNPNSSLTWNIPYMARIQSNEGMLRAFGMPMDKKHFWMQN